MIIALLISTMANWVLLILLSLAVIALYRHFGQLYINSPSGRDDQGPEVGSHLLSTSVTDITGDSAVLPLQTPQSLIFADTSCSLCSEVRAELAIAQLDARWSVIVFYAGRIDDVAAWATDLPVTVRVIHDARSHYANKYEVNGTPYSIIVNSAGVVHGKSIVNGAEGVQWMVTELRHAEMDVSIGEKGGVRQ